MGGFISSGIYFSEIGFAGLVNINGSSSFGVSENIFREKDLRSSLDKEELKKFEKYDPTFQTLMTNKPILLMHGENDHIVPIEGQIDFYLQKGEEYNIQFITYKNVNHTITNYMVDDLINWLKNHFILESNVAPLL